LKKTAAIPIQGEGGAILVPTGPSAK